jgi:hypothetical protein
MKMCQAGDSIGFHILIYITLSITTKKYLLEKKVQAWPCGIAL